MFSIFSRNRFNMSVLVIDLLVGGGCLLFGLVIAIIVVSYILRRKGYYEGEKKDGKPHGIGVKYYDIDDPIEKIECKNWKAGIKNGHTRIYARDGKILEGEFINGYMLKTIGKKPNVANLVINYAMDGSGDVATKLGYQSKYGVFETYRIVNGLDSLNSFIERSTSGTALGPFGLGAASSRIICSRAFPAPPSTA